MEVHPILILTPLNINAKITLINQLGLPLCVKKEKKRPKEELHLISRIPIA